MESSIIISIKINIAHSRNEFAHFICLFCLILTTVYTLNKLPINIFVLYKIIQYCFNARINSDAYPVWLRSAKACPPSYSHVCYFGLAYGKMKVGFFFINFAIITYWLKFNYSLRTSFNTRWNAPTVLAVTLV